MTFADRLINAVGDLDFTGEPVEEFAAGAFAILASALAKLPEPQREVLLAGIEANLRHAASLFPGARAIPEVPDGYLN
jgi:hypothetical protein